MLRALPFGIVLVPPLLLFAGAGWGDVGFWGPMLFVFGLVPLLDLVMGDNLINRYVGGEKASALEAAAFRFWLYLMVPVLWGTTLWGCWVATQPLAWHEALGLILGLGVCSGGIGITLAHELVHRPHRGDRLLGSVLLANAAYMHFATEHVFGHHGKVATPEDPASAQRGETLYGFIPRSIWGSWLSAWAIEKAWLARKGQGPYHWRNPMVWAVVVPALVCLALGLLWGPWAAAAFAAQAAVGFGLLEAVNYLEHYGLSRQPKGDGRYEAVSIHHSWSSARRLTNAFLVNLQRHSDHHVWGTKPYHELLHLPEAPQLPTGYAGMILLALVPPLYFKVMDPLAEQALSAHQREAA